MTTKDEVQCMSCSDICDFLTAKIDEIDADTIERFRSNQINGKAFLSLCEDDLKEIGFTMGMRKQISMVINSYSTEVRILLMTVKYYGFTFLRIT